MLRGISPEKIEKRLKLFLYGQAGSGKTIASIQFPCPYIIDTEKGATNDQYVELIKKQKGAIFQTSDFDELLDEVKALLTEKHNFKTLVIDPLTTVYNDLLDKAADKVGTVFGRHYGEANKQMKHLINLLLRLDMGVIITSHAKREYGDNLAVLGNTYDCYKKIDYLFDLVLEVEKRGKERVGIVKKTRIEAFAEAEQFPFNYKTIADKYGKEILEKEAVPQELASGEQLEKISNLIDVLKVENETINKWLKKAECASLDELPDKVAKKIIENLSEKLKKVT